jgi:hypothetical protein
VYAKQELRDCGGGTEQIWDVIKLSDARFELRNRASQLCLGFQSGMDAEGKILDQNPCGGVNTTWASMFTKSSGGYLRAVSSGTYLSVRDAGTANGTLVTAMEYAATTDEQWVLEPVSEGAVQPQQIWVSSGKPITSFAGTAVVFQPVCTATDVGLRFEPTGSIRWWRVHTSNPIRNLVRADLTTADGGPDYWQICVVSIPTSSKMEVTLKNVGANAYAREGTNPSAALIADQTNAASAERFIMQKRKSKLDTFANDWDVLQSKRTGKYAVPDTAAAGASNRAVRFTSATPTAATEIDSTAWF